MPSPQKFRVHAQSVKAYRGSPAISTCNRFGLATVNISVHAQRVACIPGQGSFLRIISKMSSPLTCSEFTLNGLQVKLAKAVPLV